MRKSYHKTLSPHDLFILKRVLYRSRLSTLFSLFFLYDFRRNCVYIITIRSNMVTNCYFEAWCRKGRQKKINALLQSWQECLTFLFIYPSHFGSISKQNKYTNGVEILSGNWHCLNVTMLKIVGIVWHISLRQFYVRLLTIYPKRAKYLFIFKCDVLTKFYTAFEYVKCL